MISFSKIVSSLVETEKLKVHRGDCVGIMKLSGGAYQQIIVKKEGSTWKIVKQIPARYPSLISCKHAARKNADSNGLRYVGSLPTIRVAK